jgi:hypothetical protein
LTNFQEALERCRLRRILAWEDLEEFELGRVTNSDGVDLTAKLIERAKSDIELMDFLILSFEAFAAGGDRSGSRCHDEDRVCWDRKDLRPPGTTGIGSEPEYGTSQQLRSLNCADRTTHRAAARGLPGGWWPTF